MANEKRPCDQFCSWNDPSDGCIIPAYAICPMSNTAPDGSGWGNVRANEKRLIDPNALLEEIQFRRPVIDTETKIVADCVEIARKAIVNAPTVDAEPVKHEHWVIKYIKNSKYKYCFCSGCETMGSPEWKRCPVCEAKMGVDGDGV